MYDTNEKPKRRWQNLLYKKCPNCDERLEQKNTYFICPTAHPTEVGKSCFFISHAKLIELLRNPDHPTNVCMTVAERASIESVIRTFETENVN